MNIETIRSIDINCDLGEGMPCDAEIMPYISSCSIACGGHAGDETSMQSTLVLAKKHGLKLGAHPSYPDKENFGRHSMQMSKEALHRALSDQINSLLALLKEQDLKLHHVKPHGALYNDACRDSQLAQVVIDVIKDICPNAKLYAPYASELAEQALQHQIEVIYEVFADRNYNNDLSLVSRSQANALIHDSHESYQHVRRMLLDEEVLTVKNTIQTIQADTICVHSDTQEAVAIVARLRESLIEDGFLIK